MPGVLAQQSNEGPPEGKGGPPPEGEEDNQKLGVEMDDNKMIKAALEQLALEKNGGAATTDEDEEPARLSSPDSGMHWPK